jgi:hypothetical protein
MAQLWACKDSGRWGVLRLSARGYRLGTDSPATEDAVSERDEGGEDVRLMRFASDEGPAWILIAGVDHAVRINGLPLAAGIRALVDRDEIVVAGRWTYYFSVDDSPEIAIFPGSGQPAPCPRCCKEIDPGEPAVRCPGCGVWHHEDPERGLQCWTYADMCAACAIQHTSLEADSAWTPVGL